jgi:hypothetical protein
MKKKIKLVTILLVMLSTSLIAQRPTPSSNPSTKENSSQEIDSVAIEEAKKLLDEMKLNKVYENAVRNSTLRIVRANPRRYKKIEKRIRNFYEKYIGWDVIKDDLAKLYAKYFTAEELRDILKFYKTKTGKKVLATMGKLAYEGQMLTRKRLVSHMPELQQILDDALKDKNKSKKSK